MGVFIPNSIIIIGTILKIKKLKNIFFVNETLTLIFLSYKDTMRKHQ